VVLQLPWNETFKNDLILDVAPAVAAGGQGGRQLDRANSQQSAHWHHQPAPTWGSRRTIRTAHSWGQRARTGTKIRQQ
jgi:hypothetical protein